VSRDPRSAPCDIRDNAAAIERYARTIRLSASAVGAAQTIARRAEVRIGELDVKRKPPGKRSFPDGNELSRKQRHENRAMAGAAGDVETVLGELAPAGQSVPGASAASSPTWKHHGSPASPSSPAVHSQIQTPSAASTHAVRPASGSSTRPSTWPHQRQAYATTTGTPAGPQ
jgi:hypothetical protein